MTRTARSIAPCSIFLLVAAALGARPAFGHAKLVTPKPRDSHADYKDPPQGGVGTGAPCGVVAAASQPSTTLAAGAPLTVTWQETVTHPGCFVIDFAAAGDSNFQILGVKSHANPPSTATPRNWTVNVTLPGAACTGCTLRLRQLMLAADLSDAQCPPATIPAASTYYSCANVVLTGGTGTGSGGTTGASGAGGTTGAAGRGGSTGSAGASGSAGATGTGRAGATGTVGTAGATGAGTAGATGTVGTAGTTGTVGTAGATGSSGTAGDAATTGAAGATTTSGTAGTTGSTGAAGSEATGSGAVTGGCQIAPGAGLAPSVLLAAAALLGRRRRRRDRR